MVTTKTREGETQVLGVRATAETIEKLRALRERLELSQQYGRVSMGEALGFAVSSASAALAMQPVGGNRDGPS